MTHRRGTGKTGQYEEVTMTEKSVDVLERDDIADGEATQRSVDESVESRRRIRTAPARAATVTAPPEVRPAPAIGRATVRPVRTRVSAAATMSLVIGVAAVLATLTGLLAPIGVVFGAVALLFSLVGSATLRHHHVNGYGITIFGLLSGLAAVVLGVLAVRGQLSWLSSDTDQVARVHTWLSAHASWLNRW
jgi:hypothetical protein